MDSFNARIELYDNGQMDEAEESVFFQDLIDSGRAWTMHGGYRRTAAILLAQGKIIPRDEHSRAVKLRGEELLRGELRERAKISNESGTKS